MVDIDAAVRYVRAHGDLVEQARLACLQSGTAPPPAVVDRISAGQATGGGWPASGDGSVASVDATCFRLAELDDLDALDTPATAQAVRWLVGVQRPDGAWEEDPALAAVAPPWALPGDPEARLYLTAVAGFRLAVAAAQSEADPAGPGTPARYTSALRAAADFVAGQIRPAGSWPSFLAAGWHAAALLHHQGLFYEAARVQYVLGDRLPDMSPADVASMAAVLRRLGGIDDWLLAEGRKRLTVTQRSDGGWDSDEGPVFDVHATLVALRACR